MQRSFAEQQRAFAVYQECVAAHQSEVELHNVSKDLIQLRDNRAMMEAVYAQDPRMRQQYPGGVDQIVGVGFARYKSLGGTAASIAQVQALPTPCPPPGPDLTRLPPRGPSPVTDSKSLPR